MCFLYIKMANHSYSYFVMSNDNGKSAEVPIPIVTENFIYRRLEKSVEVLKYQTVRRILHELRPSMSPKIISDTIGYPEIAMVKDLESSYGSEKIDNLGNIYSHCDQEGSHLGGVPTGFIDWIGTVRFNQSSSSTVGP